MYADCVIHGCSVQDLMTMLHSHDIDNASKHVHPPGADMQHIGLLDDEGALELPFIANDVELGKLARACVTELSKLVYIDVQCSSSTRLALPAAYIIPGGRFRELYYWDSYFAAAGLKVIGEQQLINALATNLLSLSSRNNFPPNGARAYFTSRSQPPLLAPMLSMCTLDPDSHSRALTALLHEHLRLCSAPHCVKISDADGEQHWVHRYIDLCDKPRLECLSTDEETVDGLPQSEQLHALRNIRAACASGWDFSSRWIDADGRFICTEIAACDLQAFVLLLEQKLAHFLHQRSSSHALEFKQRSERTEHSLHKLFFFKDRWYDLLLFDISNDGATAGSYKQRVQSVEYASSFIPLACTIVHSADVIVDALQRSSLLGPSGIMTSTNFASAEQWDGANVFPPIMMLIFDGLVQHNRMEVAKQIAEPFLRSCHKFYSKTGTLPEKLREFGSAGSGGEYNVQTGFAWTCGACLHMMNELRQE